MDKTIMITGSSRGLGAQIAKDACKKGYYYYGISRFNDLDVVNYDDIKNYILGFYDSYYDEHSSGRPVALINNAGICVPENIFELNIENFIETFRVNLFGLKVYCVAPGAFESDMRREIAPDDDFEKMLKPDKVAKFILSLVEDGDLLDGQIIKIIK